ncbi:dTDP-glucose 4,6-dehydratase [Deinococcus knuensis]|uniref:dTDP-glucose 4,6-dehydratase n=1 Tax=Deinococcus knuensis TaxID=1837380 RepID=A0ABQ2SEG7_9DEIO|nr:dTDP-glucose 4,6-dehydratase [Deinococcus knuensis]GGS25443.1 dTDP-glucose 4,6-dehydratase [Deinococcus knuensis]
MSFPPTTTPHAPARQPDTWPALLVTGGCGFIGSRFVERWRAAHPAQPVVVLDSLTYAGRPENLAGLRGPALHLEVASITDADAVRRVCDQYGVGGIVNFAAQTHVDQSILGSLEFTHTNVLGTHTLLEVARERGIHLHQVSTDEVYGDVPAPHHSLETDPLTPRSPYAASKAAADHLVLAYHQTHGSSVTVTRAANNVGPRQHLEKALALFATNALLGLPLPLYGDGLQQRDYMHVDDHCAAIELVLRGGASGGVFNVGTGLELSNRRMAQLVTQALGLPDAPVRHVSDRPGHDRRYSLNTDRVQALGWAPDFTPEQAVLSAARWYAANRAWWEPIRRSEAFAAYYERQYAARLGAS